MKGLHDSVPEIVSHSDDRRERYLNMPAPDHAPLGICNVIMTIARSAEIGNNNVILARRNNDNYHIRQYNSDKY